MSEIKKVLWKLLSTIQGVRLLGRVSKNQSLCGSFGKFYKLISVHLSLSVSKPKWGEGNGNLLQYSCLENPVDSGAWGLLSIGSCRVGHNWSDLACMNALEKEMATQSNILAWRIPGTEQPGGLPSVGSHRVGHDWSDAAAANPNF